MSRGAAALVINSLVFRLSTLVAGAMLASVALVLLLVYVATTYQYLDEREAEGQRPPAATEPTLRDGREFAQRVWKRAAWSLLAVVTLAIALTIWILRRSLRPISLLTRASEALNEGLIPTLPVPGRTSTEFQALFGAFEAATTTMAETEVIRRHLISDITHELRTPVTNIRGQLEALDARLIEPDGEFIQTLQYEARLLERLVEDFQQIQTFDAGTLRLRLQPIPLAEAVENILAPLLDHANATADFDLSPDLTVLADEERLRQVLVNLFENSAREKPEGLHIGVRGERSDTGVRFSFEDNGPGIAAVDQPHVFKRFFRVEKSRNRATGGSGLGLTIVKGLLEAMDGSIRYLSREGAGAVFEMTLPSPEEST
ncbi:MAG: HAMP domain-containing sensor histidine kinase [Pseudomonadota bacterium]